MNGFYAAMIGWSFALALFVMWRLFRCLHAWELIDKTEFPSPIENFRAAGGTQMNHWVGEIGKLCSRTVVLAIRCSKCGAAKIHRITQES